MATSRVVRAEDVMIVGLVILGVLAALAAAGLALFTLGEVVALGVLALIIVGIVAGIILRGPAASIILAGFAVIFVGSVAYGGWSGYQVISALTTVPDRLTPRTRRRWPRSSASSMRRRAQPASASL